ncbi:uncharacterized protein [Penaeus vannamei]|uniref:uncharacterized protein n=1 Tax=Penaeus vannamei TaxID=6689 RepID=UPI00387F7F0D
MTRHCIKCSQGSHRKHLNSTLNVLRRQVDSQPLKAAPELKERNPVLLADVSVKTIYRQLHNHLKFSHHIARKKPIVTLKQRQNRVAFCKKYLPWDKAKWKRVLWSDDEYNWKQRRQSLSPP